MVGKHATQLINSFDNIICDKCDYCKDDEDVTVNGRCERADEDIAEDLEEAARPTSTSKSTSDYRQPVCKLDGLCI